MIDEDRTMQLYGYHSDELSHGSHKPIIAVCDECGKYGVLRAQSYHGLCRVCNAHQLGKSMEGVLVGDKNPNFGRCGDKHPMWKGGVTPWRHVPTRTPTYKNWRTAVFERDDYTCQMCGQRGGDLEAHHIRPVRDHKNDLMVFDIDNGATLCKGCHGLTKGCEHTFVEAFEKNIRGE